jgi:hypothetical protein
MELLAGVWLALSGRGIIPALWCAVNRPARNRDKCYRRLPKWRKYAPKTVVDLLLRATSASDGRSG